MFNLVFNERISNQNKNPRVSSKPTELINNFSIAFVKAMIRLVPGKKWFILSTEIDQLISLMTKRVGVGHVTIFYCMK